MSKTVRKPISTRLSEEYRWHFKNVSPYYNGDKIAFYQRGYDSVTEMLRFLRTSYGYELKHMDSVLDIGCGIGRLAQFMAPHVSTVSCIDVSEGMVEAAKVMLKNFNNVCVEKVDGNGSLKFEEKKFDLVFSHGTFGFVSKESFGRYVQESFRCLKEGGIFVFQIPNYRIPLGLLSGCDIEKAKERLRLLLCGGLSAPTETSKLGTPKSKQELVQVMINSGFDSISIKRPSLQRIYYLVAGLK